MIGSRFVPKTDPPQQLSSVLMFTVGDGTVARGSWRPLRDFWWRRGAGQGIRPVRRRRCSLPQRSQRPNNAPGAPKALALKHLPQPLSGPAKCVSRFDA